MAEDTQFMLGTLNAKLDAVLRSLEDHKTEITKRYDDHDSRIRALEQWRWLVVGAGAAGGSAVSFLLNKLT